jgi:hypothetical protein
MAGRRRRRGDKEHRQAAREMLKEELNQIDELVKGILK